MDKPDFKPKSHMEFSFKGVSIHEETFVFIDAKKFEVLPSDGKTIILRGKVLSDKEERAIGTQKVCTYYRSMVAFGKVPAGTEYEAYQDSGYFYPPQRFDGCMVSKELMPLLVKRGIFEPTEHESY